MDRGSNPQLLESPPFGVVWPKSAQRALASLLTAALILLGYQMYGLSRWGSRPAVWQRDRILASGVDLNKASRAEILQLPGVGENLAERIEAFRRDRGPFRKVEDLKLVRGIGPAMLLRLQPFVYVDDSDPDPDDSSLPKTSPIVTNEVLETRDVFSSKKIQTNRKVNPNTAGLQELQTLPRVGVKLAERILAERKRKPFASISDLRRVSGIGSKTLEKLRPYLTLDEEPFTP